MKNRRTERQQLSRHQRRRRLIHGIESLESRRLLCVVTSFSGGIDPSAGLSLAEAIGQANNGTCVDDTIQFDSLFSSEPTVISLDQALPIIANTVTIVGPGENLLTIDAGEGTEPAIVGDGFRVFTIDDGNGAQVVDVQISGVTITGGDPTILDQVSAGGGILNAENLTLTNVIVDDNQSLLSGGGIANTGTITVIDSTISNNRTPAGTGGGIRNAGILNLTRSTVSGNQALSSSGGGVFTSGVGNETHITSSTISGNTALVGGGIYNSDALADIRFSTISNNSAGAPTTGGGVASVGSSETDTVLTQSIVAGNINSDLVLVGGDGFNSIGSGGVNLIGVDNGNGNAIQTFVDASEITGVVDPGLSPLANNGGPTQTHALLATSPAVNRGRFDDELTDQRGFPRNDGNRIDIGAFERQSQSLIVNVANDELDFTNSDTSLREAIQLANDRPSEPTSITFAAGVGEVFETSQTIALSSVLPVLLTDVSIVGPGADQLTIEASDDARVFSIVQGDNDEFNNENLQGMTLKGGSPASFDRGGDGGAIYSAENLTLRGVVIQGNQTTGADSHGGGVFQRFGFLRVLDSTIDGNTAGGNGGGIYFRDNLMNSAVLDIQGSKITGNVTQDSEADGGGVYVRGDSVIESSEVSGNIAGGKGGGVHTTVGTSRVERATIDANQALGGDGGGLFNGDGSDLRLLFSTVSGNRSVNHGGGLRTESGTLDVLYSTISGNTATGDGGGISTSSSFIDATTISNSTISGNSATNGFGGGLYNEEGITTLISTTITLNLAAADRVGGVASAGNQTTRTFVRGTIIAGNNVDDIGLGRTFNENPFVSENNNLIGTTSSTAAANNAFTEDEDTLEVTDPLLGPLANNGGPTLTHLPQLDSLAIDRGATVATENLDQRGFSRNDDDNLDIGSVERQPLQLLVTTTADELDFSNDVLSLREAIDLINRTATGLSRIGFADSQGEAFELGGSITLSMGELLITRSVSIDGQGVPGGLTIDANGSSRVFHVSDTAADLTINSLIVTRGSTNDVGGGIQFLGSGSLVLLNSQVTDNSAVNGGGGILASGNLVFLTNSSISGNISETDGGGIKIIGGTSYFGDSTISGNQASGNGAGISNDGGSATIVNSTISGNESVGSGGGGIDSSAAVEINNSTITENTASNGGGIRMLSATGNLTVRNSIVAGNTASVGIGPDLMPSASGSLTVQASLIGDNEGTGLPPSPIQAVDANGNLIGSHEAPIDARLAPLGNFGGSTRTHHPLPDSPVIDRGQNSLLSNSQPLDQRGQSRIAFDATDMGAVEFQPTITVTIEEDEIDGDNSPNDLSLREAITLANATSNFNVIDFAPDVNLINLSLGQLIISESVMIAKSNFDDPVTIDAGGSSRVLLAEELDTVVLMGLQIRGGEGDSVQIPDEANDTGGGILFIGPGTLSLFNSAVTDNSAALVGGIFATRLVLQDSTITGNTSENFGGGLYATYATIRRSTIANNVVSQGAGGGMVASVLFMENSTVSGNSAATNAGGMFSGLALITGSTITNNQSNDSGGLFLSDKLDVRNSIIANNVANNNPEFSTEDAVVSITNSLIGDNTGTGLTASATPDADGNLIGTAQAPVDPGLTPLGDYGGTTQTHFLLEGSPGIDLGNSSLSRGAVDQRGRPREVGDSVDVGAVEFQTDFVVTVAADENDGDVSAGDLSLREAIDQANATDGVSTIGFAPSVSTIGLSLGGLAGQRHFSLWDFVS